MIAQEVRLSSPARIAEAAATLHVPSAAERRNRLGMPVSVSRTAVLARLPTDCEWELLVEQPHATRGSSVFLVAFQASELEARFRAAS